MDEPVVVILVALGGDEVAVLVFRPAFVGVGAEDVGVGLAPNVVLDRVAAERSASEKSFSVTRCSGMA